MSETKETTSTAETKPKAPTTEDVLRISEFSALNACLIAKNDIASLATGQILSNTSSRAAKIVQAANDPRPNLSTKQLETFEKYYELALTRLVSQITVDTNPGQITKLAYNIAKAAMESLHLD